MPVTYPSVCAKNFTPSSTDGVSVVAGVAGVRLPKMLYRAVMASCTVDVDAPMLALSSTARAWIGWVARPLAKKVYVQLAVPEAGCQLTPPSVDTSTPATNPPTSAAVPCAVTCAPLATEPPVGEVIAAVGATRSVETLAALSPLTNVLGCACMSARRLTIAWRILVSATAPAPSCSASRPQAHWMVPAEKTSAPLGAL